MMMEKLTERELNEIVGAHCRGAVTPEQVSADTGLSQKTAEVVLRELEGGWDALERLYRSRPTFLSRLIRAVSMGEMRAISARQLGSEITFYKVNATFIVELFWLGAEMAAEAMLAKFEKKDIPSYRFLTRSVLTCMSEMGATTRSELREAMKEWREAIISLQEKGRLQEEVPEEIDINYTEEEIEAAVGLAEQFKVALEASPALSLLTEQVRESEERGWLNSELGQLWEEEDEEGEEELRS